MSTPVYCTPTQIDNTDKNSFPDNASLFLDVLLVGLSSCL